MDERFAPRDNPSAATDDEAPAFPPFDPSDPETLHQPEASEEEIRRGGDDLLDGGSHAGRGSVADATRDAPGREAT